MKIRFFNPGKGYIRIKGEMDFAIQKILSEGELVLRKDVEEFEDRLAAYVGTKFAVGLNSGTDALLLSLKAAGIGPGDEVITVSNTFKATIEAIIHAGAKPILVDINDDYVMDMDKLEEAITADTAAIIPVHLSGVMCDMDRLFKIAAAYNIKTIIEDAAQSLGAYKNPIVLEDHQMAGSFGLTGCFSFYPAKILGAYGDAGAITTDDYGLYRELKEMRQHYKSEPGKVGYNSRLDNLQAAILNVKMKYLDDYIQRRRWVSSYYLEELSDLPFTLPNNIAGRVWQDFIIRSNERDDLMTHLQSQGIEVMVPPILPHKELNLDFKLPKSEKYNDEYLRLPCNAELSDEDVYYVVDKIKEFYA